MTKPTTIVRYLDRDKVPSTGVGGHTGLYGVPLRDLTQADWDGLPRQAQASVEASPLYRKTKPDGWVSQEALDQQAFDEWAKAHPEQAHIQEEHRANVQARVQAHAESVEAGTTPANSPTLVESAQPTITGPEASMQSGQSGQSVEPTGEEAAAEDASEGAGAEEPA